MEERIFDPAPVTRDWLIRRFAETPRAEDAVRGDHLLSSHPGPRPPLVPAAVLVPIVDRTEGLTILLTRRTAHLDNHAGQISFPGGRMEPSDRTSDDAALRETREEIGLASDRLKILGRLDRYLTRTGFSVTPVVGIVSPPVQVEPDPFEVAEIFEVPLDFVLDVKNHQRLRRRFEGREYEFYAIPWGDYFIWGATAGMLVNLCEFLSRPETAADCPMAD